VYGTIAAEVVAHRWLLLDWSLAPERIYDEPTSQPLVSKGLIKLSGRELVANETFGARQPELSFSLMVALLFGPGLVDEMIMVPCQHKKIQGLVRHHGTEFNINRFGLCKRD
jgi:hypothetical protein